MKATSSFWKKRTAVSMISPEERATQREMWLYSNVFNQAATRIQAVWRMRLTRQNLKFQSCLDDEGKQVLPKSAPVFDHATREAKMKPEEILQEVAVTVRRTKGYRECFAYSAFFLLYMLVVSTERNTTGAYQVRKSFEDAIYGIQFQGRKHVGDITTVDDLWDWLEAAGAVMFPSHYPDGAEIPRTERGLFFNRHRVLAGMIVVFTRWPIEPCPSPYWASMHGDDEYADDCLVAFEGGDDRSSFEKLVGTRNETFKYYEEWKGFTFPYLADRTSSVLSSLDQFAKLRASNVLDERTRTVDVKMAAFSGGTTSWVLVTLRVLFQRSGFVETSLDINSLWIEAHADPFTGKLLLALEGLLGLCVLGLWVWQFLDILNFTMSGLPLKDYFTNVWHWIDISSLTLLAYLIGTWTTFLLSTNKFEVLPNYDLLKEEDLKLAAAVFSTLESYMAFSTQHLVLNSFSILLCAIRLYKLFTFQDRIKAIHVLLVAAIVDVMHSMVFYSFVVVGFAVMGVFVFGAHLREFSTVTHSLVSLMKGVFGHWDYEATATVHPVGAAVYFVMFMTVCVFAGTSLFLGVLVRNHIEEDRHTSSSLWADFSFAVGRVYSLLLRSLSRSMAHRNPLRFLTREDVLEFLDEHKRVYPGRPIRLHYLHEIAPVLRGLDAASMQTLFKKVGVKVKLLVGDEEIKPFSGFQHKFDHIPEDDVSALVNALHTVCRQSTASAARSEARVKELTQKLKPAHIDLSRVGKVEPVSKSLPSRSWVFGSVAVPLPHKTAATEFEQQRGVE